MELADAERGYELAISARQAAERAQEIADRNVAYWGLQIVLAQGAHLALIAANEETGRPELRLIRGGDGTV